MGARPGLGGPTSGKFWELTSTSQLTLSRNDAGTNFTVSMGTSTSEPYLANTLTLTNPGGGSSGYRVWLTDFVYPAGGCRFRIGMGKRSANVIPWILPVYQAANRCSGFCRDPTTTTRLFFATGNETVFASGTWSSFASTFELGTNANEPTSIMEVDVHLRQPSSGVDPGFGFYLNSRATASQNTMYVNGKSSSYAGGTPPSSSWSATWQSGGTIGLAVGMFGTATADASEIAISAYYL